MSYCVNCGVELASTERVCPLCDTEVINPKSPWTEPRKRAWPERAEGIMRRADRKYFVGLAALLLLIPAAAALLCDWLLTGELSWSLYVIGSIAMIYVFVLLPFGVNKPSFDMCMAANTALTILFLALLENLSGGDWFLAFGLPLAIVTCTAVYGAVKLCCLPRVGRAAQVGVVLAIGAVYVVALDLLLALFKHKEQLVSWSLYAAVPMAILCGVFFFIQRRIKLKEELKRRFHI